MTTEMRISRHAMFMEMAHVVAKRSTCLRLNVGAVAVVGKTPVSIGYNGAPPGMPHCTYHTCSPSSPCKQTVHAEVNALERAGVARGIDMYVTHSPCPACFDHMWATGRVNRIFFGTPFREIEHLTGSLFEIDVYRVLPSGIVIDWTTGVPLDAS